MNQCEVMGDVCKNGGTCQHVSPDNFKCLCTAGWTGQNCEKGNINIHVCLENPDCSKT